MFFSARLKLVSQCSREKQMAEPGSLGSHGGHLCLTASPRGLLQSLGLPRARLCPSTAPLKLVRSGVAAVAAVGLGYKVRQGLVRVLALLPWH